MPASDSKPSRAIVWFRRDLRLTDNPALHAAHEKADEIIPVYILSDWKNDHAWTGVKRQKFLCDCLDSLSGNFKHGGGQLIIRQGDAVEELLKLAHETRADSIYLNRDVDSFGRKTEERLEREAEIAVHQFLDAPLHDAGDVLKSDGSPYRVYTPYSKPWLALDKPKLLGRPRKFRCPKNIKSLALPTIKTWGLSDDGSEIVPGGEKAARERMREAMNNRLDGYAKLRDVPSVEGTSRLSQDLRWGTLSIREVYQEATKAGSLKYQKELGWRDFYLQILHHFPDVLELEFNPNWRGLPWDEPGEKFEAWKEGRTGFPIIDAGMRELVKTGYMHNRVRMITAMFLTKDLHLDWRLGEQFFAQHLIDGEIASNNGGWQWSAGTGADAAPYFRIQNPWSQSKRHDPEAKYIKQWIPEVADLDPKLLFDPPEDGKPLTANYPAPIVNHREERDRTLAIFKKHKEQQA